MKIIKSLFSNVAVLAILLILGVGLIISLSTRSQDNVTAQSPEKQSTAIQDEEKPTPQPDPGQKPTLTPTIDTTIPEDDRPEPTWTPVIILPDAPQPTDPPKLPTPIPTPVNPNESIIATFDRIVGNLSISPDDNILAMSVEVDPKSAMPVGKQIWTVDVNSKVINKLDIYGAAPIWSPDGQHILFQFRPDFESVEIKIVDKNGKNEKSLFEAKADEFVEVDWLTPEQVSVTKLNEVVKVDLSGRVADRKSLNLPSNLQKQNGGKISRSQDDTIVVLDRQANKLLVIREDGQTQEITDIEDSNISGREITDFFISDDQRMIAYIVNEGPNNELWVNDLFGSTPKKIYRLDFRSIRDVIWMPDNRTLLVGWGESGTNNPTVLTWIDIQNGTEKPAEVHGIGLNPILSHRGDKIFYRRVLENKIDDIENTTLYQLEIQ